MLLLFKFQRNRLFWKLRYHLNLAKFLLNKIFFEAGENKRHIKETLSITNELIRIVIFPFLMALFLIFTLEGVEKILINFLRQSNLIILKNLLNYIKGLQTSLFAFTGSFETLLSTIASVSGVFIGLYFTAISVVAGSVFAKVPSNLRDLLLKEKVGNVYIRILSLLTAISIILLGLKSFGGQPGILNSLFIVLLGCFGIFCFTILGKRAFFFFDPTKLSETIFYDLSNVFRFSTINGFRWFDPNFQSHYQKVAAQNISTLFTLIKLCSNEPHLQKQPLSIVLQKSIYFLINYQQQRSFIPSDSRWYALMPRYKSWFLYDSSALTIALQTQTSIQPEMVPNPYWLEDDIVEILSTTLETLIRENNFEVVYETINALHKYFENLGLDLELKKGRDIINTVCSSIEKYYDTHSPKNIPEGYKGIELALFDAYGLSIMSLALGFFKSIRDLKTQNILEKIDTINWLKSERIYKKDFEPLLLSRIEFIHKKLKFERVVEGKFISPQWYIRQLIIMQYAELFQEAVNELISSLETFFVLKSESLLSKKSFIFAAHHSQRGLEMCNKMRAHLTTLKVLVEELEKIAINKELPWPKWNWTEIENKMNKFQDKLVEILAKCIPALSQIEQKENFPDMFGQTYNIVCQDCYEAMILAKADKFKNLFPLLFVGALAAHEKLREQLKDWQPETGLTIAIEPLMDIMELSGYAKIYSELFEIPNIWNICKTTWDEYFKSHTQPNDAVKFLIKLYQYRKSLFQISPRDILRTNWQISFNNKLREMNLIDDMFSFQYYGVKESKTKHKSPLIRAICRGRYEPHISAAEVFIIIYLLKRPESKGIEFKDMWQLSEAIEREENRSNNIEDI